MKQNILSQIESQNLAEINSANDYVVLFYYPKRGYGTSVEYGAKGAVIGGVAGKTLDIAIKVVPQLKPLKIIAGKRLTLFTTTLGGWIGSKIGHDSAFEYGAVPLLLPYDENLLKEMKCELAVPLGYRPE